MRFFILFSWSIPFYSNSIPILFQFNSIQSNLCLLLLFPDVHSYLSALDFSIMHPYPYPYQYTYSYSYYTPGSTRACTYIYIYTYTYTYKIRLLELYTKSFILSIYPFLLFFDLPAISCFFSSLIY